MSESHDHVLGVPYLSQFLHIETPDYRPRSCGMTCVRMALAYHDKEAASIDELVTKGMAEGGYSKAGWIHDYLLEVFRAHGLEASRKEKMADEDVRLFADSIREGHPAIASVIRRVDDRTEFHMVLVTGYRESEGKLQGLFYHDPAGREAPGLIHVYQPLPDFLAEWRRMAIFPRTR